MTNHPDMLGLTAAQYAASCAARGLKGGAVAAFDRYVGVFKRGELGEAGAFGGEAPIQLPSIGRVLTSESDEGTVTKFTLRIGVKAGTVPTTLGASSVPQDTAEGHSGANLPDGPRSPATVALPVLAQGITEIETESVLIPMIGKKRERSYTLCVSSQVGCAMGCGFCQTAQMGLIRSLSAGEIVAQLVVAMHRVERPDPAAPINNIVFMGMGEPMDNIEQVIQAIAVMTDRRGPAISMSRITVSTVGRIDGIKRLAEQVRQPEWHRLALAVSLNSPTDAIRSRIMPINRAMPLAKLREALLDWPFYGSRHLCLEYVYIPGVNDQDLHAEQLAAFVKGDDYSGPPTGITIGLGEDQVRRFEGPPLTGMVNVIPYNPRDNSPWPAPSEEAVDRFMEVLKGRMVYCKRRRTKGRDTMAACGQLGNASIRRKDVLASLAR